ncbi:DUF1566 domain-containing protein [Rhodoferax saidenbachensis]|uniref:Lcl C-terminal domain-containing protein n=1 Tax=Rhodoferax saidenbachensis TaxID=1484693 RepID=A0ABU1ZMZ9_9BURK|nr:DUF1566 domain-containing protein [Rhodoferax saidenbachensis]MDR7306935.1 hypothetical protein [Rhodoferax saidenbachensis]
MLTGVTPLAAWAKCDKKPTKPDTLYQEVAGSQGAEVRDPTSHLVWQRCLVGKQWDAAAQQCTGAAKKMSWQAAMTLPPSAGQGVASRWRLPSYIELLTLVDLNCSGPAVNARWFGDSDASYLWSSSSYEQLADYAWGLKYARGEIIYDSKVEEFQARLVRFAD